MGQEQKGKWSGKSGEKADLRWKSVHCERHDCLILCSILITDRRVLAVAPLFGLVREITRGHQEGEQQVVVVQVARVVPGGDHLVQVRLYAEVVRQVGGWKGQGATMDKM